MKAGLLVGVGCGAILGAAVWFALADGEPVVSPVTELPPTPTAVAAPPRPMVRQDLVPSAPTPMPTEKLPEPVAVDARPAVPPPPSGTIAAPPPPVDVPEDPPALRFKGESRELDYADNLLGKKNPTLDEVRSANNVFARCVEVDPENERCTESLERSRLVLSEMSRARRGDPSLTGARVFTPLNGPTRLPKKR